MILPGAHRSDESQHEEQEQQHGDEGFVGMQLGDQHEAGQYDGHEEREKCLCSSVRNHFDSPGRQDVASPILRTRHFQCKSAGFGAQEGNWKCQRLSRLGFPGFYDEFVRHVTYCLGWGLHDAVATRVRSGGPAAQLINTGHVVEYEVSFQQSHEVNLRVKGTWPSFFPMEGAGLASEIMCCDHANRLGEWA